MTIASFSSKWCDPVPVSAFVCLCALLAGNRRIVRGRCRVPPPPLHCWQPADLRGWLFGVALCTRRRRPHCVKEKRREAILVLVLSPTEALRKRTEAPHGFAWMGKRLICFSVCKLRHQQRISKGMAQRNRKWPNRHTRSLGHLQKWRSNQDRSNGWALGELRQHQVSSVPLAQHKVSSVPLALSVLLRGRTSHHHLGTLSSQGISLHQQLLFKDVQICSMVSSTGVQRYTQM